MPPDLKNEKFYWSFFSIFLNLLTSSADWARKYPMVNVEARAWRGLIAIFASFSPLSFTSIATSSSFSFAKQILRKSISNHVKTGNSLSCLRKAHSTEAWWKSLSVHLTPRALQIVILDIPSFFCRCVGCENCVIDGIWDVLSVIDLVSRQNLCICFKID